MPETTTKGEPREALAAAEEDIERARERIEEFGRTELERLQEAYEDFTGLLETYEEPATGDGNFETFIEFQGEIETYVERLPSDLLLREVFVESDDYLQQRRLSEEDFAHVREQLQPVADLIGRLADEREALNAYRQQYSRLQRRRRELARRVEDLERLVRLGEADLDAPTERLRDPIEAYNEAVREAFATFRREAPARDLLALVEATANYPLVEYRLPPETLAAFLDTSEVGREPLPTLLAYADYSESKLAHYVDDPGPFERHVASRQTYLERLDAGPLAVDWPPPAPDTLRYRTREYRAVVGRFAPEEVVAKLRTVRRLPRRTDYERLRDSAVASAELSPEERERLRSGDVETELEGAREELAAIRNALEAYRER
ncbi:MAG: hypothetical protein V5A43_00380 [Haloarculaceae archaeon]